MSDPNRPPSIFLADDTALDFLNTIAAPRITEFEWLETGSDVLDWFIQSELATEAEVNPFRLVKWQDNLKQVTIDLRNFREEFRMFINETSKQTDRLKNHPMLSKINSLMQNGVQYLEIDMTDTPAAPAKEDEKLFKLSCKHRLRTPHDLLPRMAITCAQLICEADFRNVRNCEGPTCTMFFLDVSKNHKRRWCSMEVCGNRAKAAAYRKNAARR